MNAGNMLAQAIELDQAKRAMRARPVLHPTWSGKRPRPREVSGPFKGIRKSYRGHLRRLIRAATEVRIALEQKAEREARRNRSRLEEDQARAMFAKIPGVPALSRQLMKEASKTGAANG